ncbi:hypothetical protein ACLOJK_001991 [Asimina triloba]
MYVHRKWNKIDIVNAGALEPLLSFLRLPSTDLCDYATAALLTLSASNINKPTISTSGAIPLLIKVLRDGNAQAKADALTALHNLSTVPRNVCIILSAGAVSPIVNLLKNCKKSSKMAEKRTWRIALMGEESGVLTVVEVLEEGLAQSREHAVGALLTMCESDRSRYREAILKEGAIPGLLELTVKGTPKSQAKARVLLQLLRDSPTPRPELQADTLQNIVSQIVSQIDGKTSVDSLCAQAQEDALKAIAAAAAGIVSVHNGYCYVWSSLQCCLQKLLIQGDSAPTQAMLKEYPQKKLKVEKIAWKCWIGILTWGGAGLRVLHAEQPVLLEREFDPRSDLPTALDLLSLDSIISRGPPKEPAAVASGC